MPIDSAYEGEDVPLQITYTSESDGSLTDPDAAATITITYNSDGTEVISAVAMTAEGTGEFEYVWDTAADASGTGTYVIEITADFGGETKITKDTIQIQ